MTITPKSHDDAPSPPTGNGGWLNALRARLGLAQGATLRDTIEDALKESLDGTTFSAPEREMLQRTLRFGTLRVDDIMVPRSDIIALDESGDVRTLLQNFDDAGVSRIPVFRETLDDPRGMIHIKDLLRWLMGDATGRPATEGRAPTLAGRPKPPDAAPAPEASIDLGKADLAKSIASTWCNSTWISVGKHAAALPPRNTSSIG